MCSSSYLPVARQFTITGRFDVNYILGQQMVGGKQQTVVVDYTSKTDQEELEYQELSYEQATFDFI